MQLIIRDLIYRSPHKIIMELFSNLFRKKESKPSEPKRERLEDFFKIDIRDVFKYGPKYSSTEISMTGNEVKHYNLRLKELELDLFFEIEILQVADNEFTLIFKGKENKITTELSNFIDFYIDKFGLDEMGCGKIEQSDYDNIQKHIFSRMWKKLMIDNNEYNASNGNIEMTLLGLKMNVIK